MNSLDIRIFRLNLVNYINNNQLPTEVKRLVVKDILGELEELTLDEVEYLKNQMNKEEEDGNTDNTDTSDTNEEDCSI